MSDHPKHDLIRMVPSSEAEIRSDDDGNTLIGVPIVFNRFTEINGWEGNFLERIDPGAVTKTLKERGDQIKVLFNHGFDPQIGQKPLGKPSRMDVRDDGLHVEVPLSDTSYNADIKALLRDGALDGMSFRFSVVKEEWEDAPKPSKENPRGLPTRTVKELALREFGPVTFPAYEATTVGVRSADQFNQFTRGDWQPPATDNQITVTTEPEVREDDDHSAEDDTVRAATPHSTAAKRSLLLRSMTEALNDPANNRDKE